MVFTEMVTAEGIVRGSRKTMYYLESVPEERPIAAHIYGSNPDSLAGAARIIESMGRFDLIDINCGCPVRKIAGKGSGVALMRDPERLKTIVQAVHNAVSLPVTVKTRLGISRKLFNISEVSQAIEEGGASAIFLHARFASDYHAGPADWETLRCIKMERSIPVIGNGGIMRALDASRMLKSAGVDGIMIGQAAIGNPWIFEEISALWSGNAYDAPSKEGIREVIIEHLNGLYDLMRGENSFRKHPCQNIEQAVCRQFQAHLSYYLRGMPGVNDLKRNLLTIDSIKELIAAIDKILYAQPFDGRLHMAPFPSYDYA